MGATVVDYVVIMATEVPVMTTPWRNSMISHYEKQGAVVAVTEEAFYSDRCYWIKTTDNGWLPMYDDNLVYCSFDISGVQWRDTVVIDSDD